MLQKTGCCLAWSCSPSAHPGRLQGDLLKHCPGRPSPARWAFEPPKTLLASHHHCLPEPSQPWPRCLAGLPRSDRKDAATESPHPVSLSLPADLRGASGKHGSFSRTSFPTARFHLPLLTDPVQRFGFIPLAQQLCREMTALSLQKQQTENCDVQRRAPGCTGALSCHRAGSAPSQPLRGFSPDYRNLRRFGVQTAWNRGHTFCLPCQVDTTTAHSPQPTAGSSEARAVISIQIPAEC